MPAIKLVPVLVAVVAVVAVGLVIEAEGQENIKVCGRDLIRKAVSYCGNSRLKRAVLTMDGPKQQGGDAFSPPPSQPGEQEDREYMEALVARWLPLSARMRRTALKISDLCCEKGCSKRELIQFC